MSGGRGGSHAKHSNGLGSQIDRQREARPHLCRTQTKRSGELANQARKMRRSLRKTFPKKVIDGLLKLPYTDKCRWQAFPPREGHSTPLSFADPAAGLFSSGPAVSAGRRGFHTPSSPPSSATFPFPSFPRESAGRLSSLNAQLCAFGVMLSPCGTMRATMKGAPNGEDVQIARGLP